MPNQFTQEKKRGSKYYICFLIFFVISFSVNAQRDSSILRTDSASTTFVLNNESHNHAIADENQHVYKMNYWFTGTFCAVATAANLYAIPHIIHGKSDMSVQDVLALDKNNVNGFDRWALELDPAGRDAAYKFTDIFLPGMIAVSGASFSSGQEN